MSSLITARASSSTEIAPPDGEDLPDHLKPKLTSTPRTPWAPRGRTTEDPTRGSIFWEAEEIESSPGEGSDASGETYLGISPTSYHAEVRHFKVEWLSTERLSFRSVYGLRNPWNANREVKVARDGTEIEPSVGKCLIDMFRTSSFA